VHILNGFAVLTSLISFFNIIRTHFIVWRIYSLFPINVCAKKGFSKQLCCVVLSPFDICFHTNVYENKKSIYQQNASFIFMTKTTENGYEVFSAIIDRPQVYLQCT